MLNCARPAYALANLPRYAKYGSVKQILCFINGAPLPGRKSIPRKCALVEASTHPGLYARLAVASLATTGGTRENTRQRHGRAPVALPGPKPTRAQIRLSSQNEAHSA